MSTPILPGAYTGPVTILTQEIPAGVTVTVHRAVSPDHLAGCFHEPGTVMTVTLDGTPVEHRIIPVRGNPFPYPRDSDNVRLLRTAADFLREFPRGDGDRLYRLDYGDRYRETSGFIVRQRNPITGLYDTDIDLDGPYLEHGDDSAIYLVTALARTVTKTVSWKPWAHLLNPGTPPVMDALLNAAMHADRRHLHWLEQLPGYPDEARTATALTRTART